jgi:hypothetical protein
VGHDQTVTSGTVIPLTTLFTGLTDPDAGDAVTEVWVRDRSQGGGRLTFNGVAQDDYRAFGPIPIGQLSQWGFLAGGTDTLGLQAIDSHGAASATALATVSVSGASARLGISSLGDQLAGTSGTGSSLMGLYQSAGGFVFRQDLGSHMPDLQMLNDWSSNHEARDLLFGATGVAIDAAMPVSTPEGDHTLQKMFVAHFELFVFH